MFYIITAVTIDALEIILRAQPAHEDRSQGNGTRAKSKGQGQNAFDKELKASAHPQPATANPLLLATRNLPRRRSVLAQNAADTAANTQ